MKTIQILDDIRSQVCNIESIEGVIIGQARCTVTLPSTTGERFAFLGNESSKILGPTAEKTPIIRLFNYSGDEQNIIQHLHSLTTSVSLSDGDYIQVRFQNLKFHPHSTNMYLFNTDDVVIRNINSQEYEDSIILKRPIQWDNINLQVGGSTRDYAFEELCRELILKESNYSNFVFLSQGPDRGRDGKYELIEYPFPRNRALKKCILQCKYSNNVSTNMNRGEIREELTKAEQHHPDYYILVTNRNTTQDFIDWFYSIETNYRFKFVLVQRQILESMIWTYPDLWNKYFG